MTHLPSTSLVALLAFTASSPLLYAGPSDSAKRPLAVPFLPPLSVFSKGKFEFQSVTGMAFAFSPDDSDRPAIDYSVSSYRLGIMLDDVSGEGFSRGNTELLAEGFFGRVSEGPGDYLGGATLILRYNFVQPETRWIPYAQLGAGAFFSDIHKDQSQDLIGQAWEYNLQAGVGIRYLFWETWAFSLEGSYRHVSNFGSSDRNTGLDALSASAGFGRFF